MEAPRSSDEPASDFGLEQPPADDRLGDKAWFGVVRCVAWETLAGTTAAYVQIYCLHLCDPDIA